jgi:hypothetical protein
MVIESDYGKCPQLHELGSVLAPSYSEMLMTPPLNVGLIVALSQLIKSNRASHELVVGEWQETVRK